MFGECELLFINVKFGRDLEVNIYAHNIGRIWFVCSACFSSKTLLQQE